MRPSSCVGPYTSRRGAFAQQRSEERQTLHVVPMQVGQQAVAAEQRVGRNLLAVVAKAGAHVEQQRILAGRVDRNARGVASVPSDVIALARRRAANAVERDAHH